MVTHLSTAFYLLRLPIFRLRDDLMDLLLFYLLLPHPLLPHLLLPKLLLLHVIHCFVDPCLTLSRSGASGQGRKPCLANRSSALLYLVQSISQSSKAWIKKKNINFENLVFVISQLKLNPIFKILVLGQSAISGTP